jgi:hypothetical protein
VGNLNEVKTVFTIDLSPFMDGLKAMLTMTQQTGAQLKPLLNVQIDNADFTQLEKTFSDYQEKVKASVPVQTDAAAAAAQLGDAQVDVEKKMHVSSQATDEHSFRLRSLKRDALESFGAISFLAQSLTSMAAQGDPANKKVQQLNQGLQQGVSAGFGLAGIMMALGIASGGVAVAIGAVVTIGIALANVLSKSGDAAERNKKVQDDFAASLQGMTIPQLEEYRKKLIETQVELKKQIDLETQQANKNDFWKSFVHGLTLGLISLADTKQAEETLQNTHKNTEALDAKIAGERKTQADVEQFILQAKIDSLVVANDRQRAEAKKTYDEETVMINASEAIGKTKDDALAASRARYHLKIREISNQELRDAVAAAQKITDAYIKAGNDRFEVELTMRRAAGILQKQDIDQLDLQLILTRKARYQSQLKELADIVGPLSPENLQKQTTLEGQISQLEAQEAEKRIAIKEKEKSDIDSLADLEMQGILSRIKLRGQEQGKTEDEINQQIISRKQMAVQAELELLLEGEAEGKPLDEKTKERKLQLENELTDLAVQGADARIQAAKNETQHIIDGWNQITQNIGNAFGSLFQLQQQSTTKTLNAEKQRRQATLDTEKARLLAIATTSEERDKIETDYAGKKDALDAEMNAKAQDQMRTAFTLQKVSQIATAMINTYSAATAALAPPPLGLGPVFGPIVAATAIAAGLANIAVISAQQVPGLAAGTKITKPTYAFLGEAGPEIVAPEKTFIDVFRTDLGPKIQDVLLPQIKASVLATVSAQGQAAQQGTVVYVNIPIQNFYGDQENFDKLKKTIEDAMRQAGLPTVVRLFQNSSKPQQRLPLSVAGQTLGSVVNEGR